MGPLKEMSRGAGWIQVQTGEVCVTEDCPYEDAEQKAEDSSPEFRDIQAAHINVGPYDRYIDKAQKFGIT